VERRHREHAQSVQEQLGRLRHLRQHALRNTRKWVITS
jgi:hypothetical protein